MIPHLAAESTPPGETGPQAEPLRMEPLPPLRIYRGPEDDADDAEPTTSPAQAMTNTVPATPIASPSGLGLPAHPLAKSVPAPTEEYLAYLKEVSAQLETATPQEIIQWAVEEYGRKLTMATAFGPEGMTIIHMLAGIDRTIPVFNLDTGYQFQETLDLKTRVLAKYGIDIELRGPETTVEEYEKLHGAPLYKTNPDQCCYDRKLKTLEKSAVGMYAWMSGIRRDQSPDRARAPIVGWDKKFGLVKISPLANSTKKDIWKLITDHDIPYNPLHDQGYTSIGCWPCTRAVSFGEDERAGRWSGFAKKECGLHTSDDK
ncbi:MAG: phosphoadenylyl-sulfate reductase [Planctomycetaceae bacterium]|nr:phosphoadenylyl-sulfate reductase [Planctomycetaceae bacterium]